ncbi:restriction endonuclease subunit S [Algoriphagus lacus]|uniref:Restriction endonuclease subunit S n=1 Tax=Algoriphagus lacus TaxID=2056311 RepID=A0A418PMA9_9BACT|nr:restriction endonuclease subunit S [Algoriphagus lacus]RIW12518.1 restriction endonuclease subunit S [Algoriphagus lacus]
MKNWGKTKLGDVCSFVRGPFGGSLKKNIFKTEGCAVYEQQHAIYDQFDDIRYFIDEVKFNEMKRFELKSGDLIMSCSGTMGKVAIVPENIQKGIINQALLKLTPSKKISTVFLKLWMQSENFQESLKEYSGGAAIQNVASVAILKQIEIPLPPLPEQQRIVSILDEAFAAIAKAKANAEQNLKNAKELFESYLQGVFKEKGDGWVEKTLGEIGSPKMCKRIFKEQTTATGDIPFYKIGTFGKEPDAFISKEIFDEFRSKYSFPKKGDVLISASGTIGRRVRYDGEPAYFQDSNIVWIDNDEKQVLNDYLFVIYEFCNWSPSKGATISRLYNSDLTSVKITFPKSKEEQKAILYQLDTLRAETQKLEALYQKKIADLEELKKSILQKAFSGELGGRDVEV